MFEPGFPVGSRLVNFVYKGVTFAVIGMIAGGCKAANPLHAHVFGGLSAWADGVHSTLVRYAM